MSPPDPQATFVALFESSYSDVVRFAQRRAGPWTAQDVAADAFLVAWRRLADLPPDPDDARAWLFGITRNVILNHDRGDGRRRALTVRVAGETSLIDDDSSELVARRVDLARAWRLLSATHQETLALSAFEGLDAPHAAAVLGISAVAYRLRLTRARRALRAHLTPTPVSLERTPAR
ncbi:RNA polymerase sigma factor [Cellulomonas sp. URHD0024]|uniref:RNA polymerase sigma factor n=1 Tax=Cellulomonas sp. URHD0024 TaxID=1302620 RepID=UPI00041B05C7|nr:RNA polymerase sigma factor [Cellulomonas sp. URHD0024]